MGSLSNEQLIEKARLIVRRKEISEGVSTGGVACALLSSKGNLYLGVCIDACCGIGFCAEHSAMAAMVTNGEYQIRKIVAVTTGGILPPCGRCRELMAQLDENNWDAEVIVGQDKVTTLKALLPEYWKDKCSLKSIKNL